MYSAFCYTFAGFLFSCVSVSSFCTVGTKTVWRRLDFQADYVCPGAALKDVSARTRADYISDPSIVCSRGLRESDLLWTWMQAVVFRGITYS